MSDRRWIRCLALCACFASAHAHAQHSTHADTVYRNARIWTADETNPHASVIAIDDSTIIYVGDEEGAQRFIGDDTATIDIDGRRIIPGLIDTHVHLQGAANSFAILNLREATSREHLLEIIRQTAADKPQDAWIEGHGWSAESWPDQSPPSADELDEASGDRPVVLTRMDGHSLIASRRALEIAGITSGTPEDPPGGTIERDANDVPTGAVFEQAMGLVRRYQPSTSDEAWIALLQKAQLHAHSLGITQVGAIESPTFLRNVVIPLDNQGTLTLRVQATISQGTDTLEEWRPSLEWATSNRHASPLVRIVGFKGYMDGSLGSRTAWMHEPYLDNPENIADDNAGYPLAMAGSGLLRDLILEGASMGLQPAVHAIGTRANEKILDWYEQIPDDTRRAVRPRIEHSQHLTPQDIARFGSLGVIPSMQPYHKADDGRYANQRIGHERNESSYAFRELIETQAALAFGSDWPVVSVNPFLGIAAAVNARTLDGDTFVPEQSITIEQALLAYTRHAAFCLHTEGTTGMLRAGYKADMLILDRDILSTPPDELASVTVEQTIINGSTVYTKN
ncbi:MAG: amidohydrolase [Planctomycetota bacterium]